MIKVAAWGLALALACVSEVRAQTPPSPSSQRLPDPTREPPLNFVFLFGRASAFHDMIAQRDCRSVSRSTIDAANRQYEIVRARAAAKYGDKKFPPNRPVDKYPAGICDQQTVNSYANHIGEAERALDTAVTAVQPSDITELASVFSEICINAFPNKDKVAALLAAKSAVSMSQSEVQRYLHADPGQGWYFKTAVTLYAITIEDPPFHTCAIRRMTPQGPDLPGINASAAAEMAYASGIGGKTMRIDPITTKGGLVGPDATALGIGVLDSAGQPTDVFGLTLSNYHGKVPDPWIAAAGAGAGVEVRLSRRVVGH
jgi:hypothetical protein